MDVHRERDRVLGIADVADLEAPKPEGCQDTVQVAATRWLVCLWLSGQVLVYCVCVSVCVSE